LVGLSVLTSLEVLDASRNRIKSLNEVLPFTEAAVLLEELDLRGNGVTKQRKYREQIIVGSRIITLDEKDVKENERTFLQAMMRRKNNKKSTQRKHLEEKTNGPPKFRVRHRQYILDPSRYPRNNSYT